MRRLDSRSVGMVTSSVNRGSAAFVPAGTRGKPLAGAATFAGGGAGLSSAFLPCARTRIGTDDSIRLASTTARPMQRIVLDMEPLLWTRRAGELLTTLEILTQQVGPHKAIPHRHDEPARVPLTATMPWCPAARPPPPRSAAT